MSEAAPSVRDGGGRGRGGRGRSVGEAGPGRGKAGGRGGRGGNRGKTKVAEEETISSSSDQPKQSLGGKGRGADGGRGAGGGRGADGGRSAEGNKSKRSGRGNNNKVAKKVANNKRGNKGQEKAALPPNQKSAAEKTREEEERKVREETEALRKRQEEERKALEMAREARKKQQEELDKKVQDAIDALKAVAESTEQHKANRAALEPEALTAARKEFQDNKKSLKTDLKKCTAFVKKVKTGAAWTMKPDEIKRDVSTLNLSRYVEEVVAALADGKFKLADMPAVLTLSIEMHLRYEEFLTALMPGLWNVINGKATEENAKARRLYVRLITEFVLNGLVTDPKPLVKMIAEATGGKDENYAVTDAPLIVAFGKAAGYEIFGKRPSSVKDQIALVRSEAERAEEANNQTRKIDIVAGEEGMPDISDTRVVAEDNSPIIISEAMAGDGRMAISTVESAMTDLAVTPDVSEALFKYCLGAYNTLSKSLVDTHAKLQKLEKRCEQDRMLSGSLTEAREKGLSDAKKLLESLQKSVDTFADVLDQPLPQLEEENKDDEAESGGVGVELWTKSGGDGENDFGPFDDEETRAFYCDIPDLLTTVPPGLLGISPEEIDRRKAENIQKYGAGFDADIVEEGDTPEEVTEAQLEAEEEQVMGGAQSTDYGDNENKEENKETPHYKLTVLLEQELPEVSRREQIDEIAEKFCTNNGSVKNSRKRLSKALFLVPRNRLDLLAYYSRMAAILDRVWPDIAPPVVKDLEQQFHGQAKFKKNQNIESRLRTARYIGELTKFRVAPPIVALRCIKRCCEDFTGANIDVACCLLESCGRYLYRIKHTSGRLNQLLETITRLSKAAHLDERSQSLIKAAFYSVKPPRSASRKQAKQYSPLESYLRHLLMVQLNPDASSISFVSKQLIRFPWNDASKQCGSLICKIMMKTCRKGRYKSIQALAGVAANLRRHRPEVSVRLIDAVLEEFRWSLEHPNFRDQQRIISYARLLGELYCVSLVSGQLVIQQLYNFINLGHEIPPSLRETCQKHQEKMATGASTSEPSKAKEQLPVYNSAGGAVLAINEDEELEEAALETKKEVEIAEQQAVAVSKYSEYDPRVSCAADPPNSAFRVKLVCTLLEVVAKNLVTRANLPKLKAFLAAFQRYLFTKTMLPTEVEFSLLDTFDVVDSSWRKVIKNDQSGRSSKSRKSADKEGDQNEERQGFPRYKTWFEAHNATVEAEEIEYLAEARSRARIETLAGESTSESMDAIDGEFLHDDDESVGDDDEDDYSASASVKDSVTEDHHFEFESGDEDDDAGESQYDETSDDESDGSNESDGDTDEEEGSEGYEDEEEEDFDEEAYMRQMEEEAFERELRRVTMEALEKGKVAARTATGGKVNDTMVSGSQIIKKKAVDSFKGVETANAPIPTVVGGGAGISFQLLKKGNKGKMETRELIVPADTNLAKAASKQDDAAARERDMIKARVLQYEAESAEARNTGGNIYLEQEKLQVIRNRPLSMDDIDRNFGTQGGNLHQNSGERPATNMQPGAPSGGRGVASHIGGRTAGRAGRSGRGGRGRTSGRSLYG